MYNSMLLPTLLFCIIFDSSVAQFLGSALYNALGAYNDNDMCRYISCPFGQYCWNGNCLSTGSAMGARSSLAGLSGLTSAASMYNMGLGMNRRGMLGGGYPTAGAGALSGALGLNGGIPTAGAMPLPMNAAGPLGLNTDPMALGGVTSNVGGLQPCNLMQQCLNGQICVNGYCSRSNVAFQGSQALPTETRCMAGAICPVGQYCIGGMCIQNPMTTTFACHNGISCPMGMMCQFGRCLPSGMPPSMLAASMYGR